MPSHAAVIDALQKQYESIKIPYGEVPAEYLKVFVHLLYYHIQL